MKIGVIGTGSMGRTLIEAWIRSGVLHPEDLVISNRTLKKAEQLAFAFPGIQVAESNPQLVEQVQCIFLCIKPSDYSTVIAEIQSIVRPEHLVVSITSPVMIHDLEERLSGKIAKIIPSITHISLSGTSLYIPGKRITAEDQKFLLQLFSAISTPLQIDEQHTRIASDLASCAPAFLANILDQMIDAATEVTPLPRQTASELVSHMVLGVGRLLTEEEFTLNRLQERVAVPGGITREGLNLLSGEFSPLFDRLFRLTHSKFAKDVDQTRQSLNIK